MKPGPVFSILLPTHNRADVLPFAVYSVLSQTVRDFELLIVGDGCTDNTLEVVNSFQDARIRWFDLPKAPNFGYANRNIALGEARGRYVAFMAHDDLWMPDHLELLSSALERNNAEIAYSRTLWVIPKGLIAPCTFNLNHPKTLEDFLSRKRNGISAGCFIHRRDCFDKYGYWNEELQSCGDLDMWARIIEGGGKKNFVYVPEPTCLHFRAKWRNEGMTGQPWLTVWKHLHDVKGFMPPALKVFVPEGVTEQEAFWREMKDNTMWTTNLREAINQILDFRVGQSDELLLSILIRDESSCARSEKLADVLVHLENLKNFTLEMEQMNSSLGWKLVRALRRVREKAFPSGTVRERALLKIGNKLRRA
jgi:hypothetical protein